MLLVEGMSCAHCASTVRDAALSCTSVTEADVDVAAGRVSLSGDAVDTAEVIQTLSAAGFPARSPDPTCCQNP